MRKSYQKIVNNNLISSLSFLFLILVSNIFLFQSYFWHDDYDHLYRALHNLPYGYPYIIFSRLAPYLYQLFGMNPIAYFSYSIVFVFLAALSLRFLLQQIFQNKQASYIGTVIFCAGYIGTDSLLMSIGDGIGTLTVLPLVLLFFALHIQNVKRNKLTTIPVVLLYVLILEFTPHRFSFLFAPTILVDLFITFSQTTNVNIKKASFRVIFFVILWLVISFIHPFATILNYTVSVEANTYQTLLTNSFSIKNFLTYGANTWNVFFPSAFHTYLVTISPWIAFTPLLLMGMFIWKASIGLRKIIIPIVIALSMFVWINTEGMSFRLSSLSGLLLLIVLALLFRFKKYRPTIFIVFSLLLLMVPFFLRANELYFESNNRYFMTVSFISSILIAGLYINQRSKLFAIGLFLFVVIKLISNMNYQAGFVHTYANHFKRIYTTLNAKVPHDNQKKLVYIEAVSKELNFAATDAFRVGAQPSEAALAVHLGGTIADYIVAESPDDVVQKVNDGKVDAKNIYSFLYDGVALHDRSSEIRRLLSSVDNPVIVSLPNVIDISYIFVPAEVVSTLLPRTVVFKREQSLTNSYKVTWVYNSSGPLGVKMIDVINFDQNELEQTIRLPGGGTYLKNITIERI